MARSKKTEFDFEKALDQLSNMVEKMEQGELSLEQSLSTFEQGIKLTRDCHHALKHAEQKVQILIEQNADSDLLDYNADEGDDAE